MKKILIALDIDGTITDDLRTVPQEVNAFLASQSHHRLVFITGRCFSLAYPALSNFDFPYLLAIHNGAIILKMPEREILSKRYIHAEILPVLDQIVEKEMTDYAIYTGVENDDLCYYRPKRYSNEMQDFLIRRHTYCGENWMAVESFKNIPLHCITAIKCFGSKEKVTRIKNNIEKETGLHTPVIQDPFDRQVFLAQGTHPEVHKGSALDKISNDQEFFIIAAGDDTNDLTMLQRADFPIVMETASQELKKYARKIAPPAKDLGIITSLTEVLEDVRNNRL